jgi:hypothetical protein
VSALSRTVVEVEGRTYAVEVIGEQAFVLELLVDPARARVVAQVPREAFLAMQAAVDQRRLLSTLKNLRTIVAEQADTPVVGTMQAVEIDHEVRRCTICRQTLSEGNPSHNGRALCSPCAG